jgi:predicted ATPase
MLVAIDNLEHLLEAARMLGELLAAAPGVTMLATSREPSKLEAEHVVRVSPLAMPDGDATSARLEQPLRRCCFSRRPGVVTARSRSPATIRSC